MMLYISRIFLNQTMIFFPTMQYCPFLLVNPGIHRFPGLHGSVQLHHSRVHVRDGGDAEVSGLLFHPVGR